MSVEYIVFISPPGGCPHCDRFRALFDQLRPDHQALFDVRTGNTPETNNMGYTIPYWPIAFSAKPRKDGKSMMQPLDENPNDICMKLMGSRFSADTVNQRQSSTHKLVKSAALIALAAWLLQMK